MKSSVWLRWHHHVHQPISFLQLIPRTLRFGIISLLFLLLLIFLPGKLREWTDSAHTNVVFGPVCLLLLLSNLSSACMTLCGTSAHLTWRVCQLISGLCSSSQVNPRMMSCLPRLVTAKVVRSVCPSTQRITSTTPRMDPASFGDPSTLNTGIGL